MKFITNKADFYQCLQRTVGVVPTKTTIPILSSILCALESSELRVTGTDLEVSIVSCLDVDGKIPGAVAIPAKKIYDIVRELPEVPLEIEVDANFVVSISSDKGRYRLSGVSSDEYPQLALAGTESIFSYPLSRFLRMVEKTHFAVSVDELRTTLMGVLLELREGEMRLVATDGHRLASCRDESFRSAGQPRPMQVVIPTKALHLLARSTDEQQDVEIGVGENHIVFKTAQMTIFSKLISGQYPSYERVIPTDNEVLMTVERDVLAAAVRRVSLFANQDTHQVRLTSVNDSLTVQAEDPQIGGDAKETVPVRFSGSRLEIGYNGQYILEVLRHLDSTEVVFELKDAGSAAIIRPAGEPTQAGEEILMLLMPIRLNDAPPP